MNLDQFYGRQRTKDYDCAAFARDVWLELTGEDLAERSAGLLAAQFVGRIGKRTRSAFRELPGPVSPCLVIFRRPKKSLHMGVYINGKVFHLSEGGSGVQYQPVEIVGRLFKTVQYALC